jgi:hypothetical protein
MKDSQALHTALARMKDEEGEVAKNNLVVAALRASTDGNIDSIAKRFSDELKEDQALRGSTQPKCGEITAMEILSQIGILLNEIEKEEDRGR